MFRKKHTVKEVQALGKSDAKKLKAGLLAVFGDEFEDVVDAVWDKKASVSRRRWQFNPGVSAVLYLVNELALVISVDGLPADAADLVPKNAHRDVLVPTVHFFLRARQFLHENPDRFRTFVAKVPLNVYCRGPTSRFLLSGAHLMIPGIVAADKTEIPPTGSLALVFSVGTDAPYAVGLTTARLTNNDSAGVGVYIINCFTDSLWQEFEAVFVASCIDKSGQRVANPLPPEFQSNEVMEHLPEGSDAAEPVDQISNRDTTTSCSAPQETTPAMDEEPVAAEVAEVCSDEAPAVAATVESENAIMNDYTGLFSEEDEVLKFAFFEAVKAVPKSMIPLPLTQFTAAVVNAYPRVNADSRAIDFKSTKYKHALTFLKLFEGVIEITEVSPGVHSITKIDKSSPLVRNHTRTFKEFLDMVQKPAKEVEARAAEMRLMEDKKTVFNQQIVSVESSYRPRRNSGMPDDVARITLEGNIEAVVAHETERKLPTLEDVEKDQKTMETAEDLPPVDDEVYSTLYPRKTIADNLRSYVKARGLLVLPGPNNAGKSTIPSVKLQGALSSYQAENGEEEIPLNKLEEIILKRHFSLITEIVIQTSVSGSATMSEFIPPRHLVKNGLPPHINVWTEKRSGNKIITIVKNLKALGFDLDGLCRAWRQRFSTSCKVVDPAAEMTNLKSGTTIPMEIHVQGDITGKLATVLTKELGIPTNLIHNSK